MTRLQPSRVLTIWSGLGILLSSAAPPASAQLSREMTPAEAVESFTAGRTPVALEALAYCPGDSEWHDQLRVLLLSLPPTPQIVEHLAMEWSAASNPCQQDIRAWLQASVAVVRDRQTARYLATGLTNFGGAADLASLRSAALDPSIPEGARDEMLGRLDTALTLRQAPSEERVALYVEALETGTIPSRYAASRRPALFLAAEEAMLRRGLEAVQRNPSAAGATGLLAEILFRVVSVDPSDPSSITPSLRQELRAKAESWARSAQNLPPAIEQMLRGHGLTGGFTLAVPRPTRTVFFVVRQCSPS